MLAYFPFCMLPAGFLTQWAVQPARTSFQEAPLKGQGSTNYSVTLAKHNHALHNYSRSINQEELLFVAAT